VNNFTFRVFKVKSHLSLFRHLQLGIKLNNALCFSSISNSLRSLDLSYNELTSLPAAALARAKSLDWLNLHGSVKLQLYSQSE
jgi:Leucine-rich repeat (LRR) protein